MSEKFELKDHENESLIFNRRLMIAGVVIVLLFVLLISWLARLQISRFDYYSARSDGNRLHSQYVAPSRGLIFDRNGVLLADNRPIFNLTVVKERVEDIDKSLALLADIIDLSESDVEQFNNRLTRRYVPYSSVTLRYQLTEKERSLFAVDQYRLPGFSVEPQFVRHYPLNALAAHSVGYVSEINKAELDRLTDDEKENYGGTSHIGKTGVEKTYEALLHGQVGYETVEKNNRGRVMRTLDRTDPVAGKNITLYLDAKLQIAVEKALGDSRGAIVAIDPATGGILAMVSNPGFDPNLFVTGISNRDYAALQDPVETPMFNRAINPYPPGSTVKPFMGLAGLNSGIIDYDYTVSDSGYFRLPNVRRRWTDWTVRTVAGGGHGQVNLQRAIFQSCNIYFYTLGQKLGIDGIHDFLSLVGFGQNFALDVPEARTGLLPSRKWKKEVKGEPWYQGDTISVSIGQGYMLATPLQLATAASIIANKGKVLQPKLLKDIEGIPYVHEMENSVPDVLLNDIGNWDFIEESMAMVIHRPYTRGHFRDEGTAYPHIAQGQNMTYRMAGKSGTAQVVNIASSVKKSSEIKVSEVNQDHGLFIAIAPVENPHIKPQIALAVFVENGLHGSSVGGVVAKEVVDAYLLDILQIDFEALEREAIESEEPQIEGESLVVEGMTLPSLKTPPALKTPSTLIVSH